MPYKKLLMGFLLLLGAAGVVGAQEENTQAVRTNAAASFELTSAAKGEASAAPGVAPAAPPARPRFVFGERDDYRWQLGIGAEVFRFLSNRFDATMVGTNSMVTYFTNGWFAFEGNLLTGFPPEIYQNEHVKLFGGGGRDPCGKSAGEVGAVGSRARGRRPPATADGGSEQDGIDGADRRRVDYRLHAWLSIRLEGDWVYTTFFSQTQNTFKALAASC